MLAEEDDCSGAVELSVASGPDGELGSAWLTATPPDVEPPGSDACLGINIEFKAGWMVNSVSTKQQHHHHESCVEVWCDVTRVSTHRVR